MRTNEAKALFFLDQAQQNNVALVTKASGGNGRAAALALANGGTSTGLLAAVNQTVVWVRLPQRFPVHIKITGKPLVPLRSGQTVTVAVVPGSSQKIVKRP